MGLFELNSNTIVGQAMEQTSASHPTILVVEDEPLVRLVGSLLLSDAGFNVIEACNAEEALRVLEAGSDVRIVFTDVEMPGALDGLGLARCVHERWPSIGVIVTSGRCEPPRQKQGLTELFVAKPYASSTLMHKIEACLASGVAA
jgi:two-component system, response regulator PdtaR